MIDYDKYQDEYDNLLNESVLINSSKEVIIGPFTKLPSQILLEMDEDLYRTGLIEYVEQKKEDYKEMVYQYFPAPIAYFYHLTERDYDNYNHRIHLLRSTWESLIYILYGIILGEVNLKKLSLKNVRIFGNKAVSRDDLISDKLGLKIEIMQKIIEYDKDNTNGLLISSYVKPDIFEEIKKLNQGRNSFSHIAALSEAEAEKRYQELYPIFADLLFELDFLAGVGILRYANDLGDIHNNRFKKFAGHSLQGRNYDKIFPDRELLKVTSLLNNKIILLELDNTIFNVSPYIHFCLDGGHFKLCYFKRMDRTTRNYIFEIVGGTEREVQVNPNSIPDSINVSLGGLL
jgi:hypothetical protein